ncbi:MAG TPA: hypothetical protein VN875_18630 [Candidatus Binatus sp.]|nr:hypothetical protein [Candidatus Binatus sp.]
MRRIIKLLNAPLFTEWMLTRKLHRRYYRSRVNGVAVESLERFAQNRRIIEHFALHWLVDVPTDLARLNQVASLCNVSTGTYYHPGLRGAFSDPAIHQALQYCHEELFDKVLEKTLEEQEADLRQMFCNIAAPAFEIASRWLELEYFRMWVPMGTPAYLRELFCSNLRVILNSIVAERSMVSTAA